MHTCSAGGSRRRDRAFSTDPDVVAALGRAVMDGTLAGGVLSVAAAAVFLPFLEKEFPHLVDSYQQRYKDRAFLPKPYGQRLSQLMARLRVKYGLHRLSNSEARTNSHTPFGTQLTLF